jgi:hypothetical protein
MKLGRNAALFGALVALFTLSFAFFDYFFVSHCFLSGSARSIHTQKETLRTFFRCCCEGSRTELPVA